MNLLHHNSVCISETGFRAYQEVMSPGFCASSSSLLPPPAAVAFGSVNSRGGCSLCRVVCSIWFKAKQKACRNDILFCLAPRVRLNRMTSTAVRLLVNSRSHVRGCILLLERTTLQLETMVVSALLFSCLRLPVSAHPQAPFSRHRRRSLSAQLTAGAAVRYAGSSALSGSRQSKKHAAMTYFFVWLLESGSIG